MSARTFLHRHGFDFRDARLLTRAPHRLYRIRDNHGRHFILRFRGSHLTPASARLQQRWLVAIARDTDVLVPTVIPLDDKPFQPADDEDDEDDDRQAALFTWVEGRRARRGGSGFVTPPKLRALGVTVAKLHRQAERFRIASTSGLRRFDVNFFFSADYSLLPPRDRDLIIKRLKQRVRHAMNELGEPPRRLGLIHGDLGPPNWLFHRGAARPIDFDDFGLGHYVLDLAQVLWTHSMWPRYDEYRRTLFAAYESVRPLDEIERRHAALFEAMPLIDWVNRSISSNDQASLKRWLKPTMKRIRELAQQREE